MIHPVKHCHLHHREVEGGRVYWQTCNIQGHQVQVLCEEERTFHAEQDPREPHDPIKVVAEQAQYPKESCMVWF